MIMKEVTCTHCGHKQKTRTKLNKVTCSNCQHKFNINNSPMTVKGLLHSSKPEENNNNKGGTPRVKLD